MPDASWRRWDRAWLADRGDQHALRQAITARRRAGIAVPARMLDEQVFPSRRFLTGLPCKVWATLPSGESREVGRTPTFDGDGVLIPEHRLWWVQPEGYPRANEVASQLIGRGVQGLVLRDGVNDRDLELLTHVGTLTHLDLGDCHQVTDAGLELLVERLPGLVELKLRRCERITARGVTALTRARGLVRLRLSGAERLNDESLAPLAQLDQLIGLNLAGCAELTDQGLATLGRLHGLESLSLKQCNRLTAAGLEALGRLESLTHLNLSWCQRIADSGLKHLRGLPLESLDLYGCNRLTDAGLAELSALASLATLSVGPSVRGITDAGLGYLAALAGLRRLNLSWCEEITDDGLAHLSGLERLEHLDLMGCSALTDAGLEHLSQLQRLERLNLWRCEGITDDALDALERPSLKLNVTTQVKDLLHPGLKDLLQ